MLCGYSLSPKPNMAVSAQHSADVRRPWAWCWYGAMLLQLPPGLEQAASLKGQHLQTPPRRRGPAVTSFPPKHREACAWKNMLLQAKFRCTQRSPNTVSACKVTELRRVFHWVPTALHSAHLFF